MSIIGGLVNKNDFVVGGRYRLMRKIGSGSFGDIYLGINVSNGEVRKEVVIQNKMPGTFFPNFTAVKEKCLSFFLDFGAIH